MWSFSFHLYSSFSMAAGHQWLMLIISATQQAKIRRIVVQSQLGQIVLRPYLKKPFTKIGLVE
jgi:hypothetical protein